MRGSPGHTRRMNHRTLLGALLVLSLGCSAPTPANDTGNGPGEDAAPDPGHDAAPGDDTGSGTPSVVGTWNGNSNVGLRSGTVSYTFGADGSAMLTEHLTYGGSSLTGCSGDGTVTGTYQVTGGQLTTTWTAGTITRSMCATSTDNAVLAIPDTRFSDPVGPGPFTVDATSLIWDGYVLARQ